MNTLVTTQNAQIKAIIGEVKLLKNNLTSELKVGSEIVAGDNLLLSENAQVTVQYSDGRIEVIFGSDGTQFVDEAQQQSIPEAIAVADEDALPDEIEDVINGVDDEISAIQSQIEGNGELDLPDTAAGTASAGGGISFSSLDRNNDETLANTAFQSEAFTPAQASIETPEIINQEIIIVSTLDAELTIDSLSQTAQITGSTTGVLPNSPVSITLTDSQGNQLTVNNVTISQDGSFNADNIDISTLSDGQISATVNVTDVNNQSVQDLSGDELDTTAPLAPTVTLNETNDDGFINLQEKDAGIDATVTLNDPNLNVGDVVEIVVTIGNNSTTSNIQVTQAIIDNPTISVSIDNTLLVDDAAVNVTATAIDDKGNRSNTGQDEAVVDINVPGGDKDQNNQSADAPTVSINEQVEDNVIDNTESSNLTARINLPQVGIEAGDSLIVTINGTEQPPITITQELIDNGFTNIVVPPSEITNGQNLQVTAKVTDPAGNSSSEGTDSALVDLSAPNSNLGPVTDIEEANNTVSENASIGDSTGVHADATDPDGDDVSYTLSDDADGRFTIDPTTGEITVAKELDFDNGDGGNHVVTVVATSTDGSTSTQNFTIDVTNADGTTPGQGDTDNPIGPVTDIDNTANTVSENAAIGDSTGVHADATDPDGDNVSYTLSDNAGGRFAIDATTG
ncbi:cadherin domain-containing protein, partial [Psychrobium sp. MM17-31]|uniref:cadherin repeat domain-containing protein n=1 Tax=Psychrobium sp. MM17-31 TaxID=2917758 RepID=UPI001EF5E4D6